MISAMNDKLAVERAVIEFKKSALQRLSPQNYIDNLRVRCDRASMSMEHSIRSEMAQKTKEFSALCAKLDAMSPLKILARGYSVTVKEGEVVSDVKAVKKGERIDVLIKNGKLECEIQNVKGN